MEVAHFKLLLPLFLSVSVLVPFAHASDFNYCDKKANYDVKVSDIDISPKPLTRGEPATFNIFASTTAGTISKGKLVVDVSYFGFHVHKESHDLCKETTCPVLIGDFVVSHTQELPVYTPPGSYTLTMRMEDENQKELTCISFGFSIGIASSVAET